MNVVTRKAGAKHELLFNEQESEASLLNKSSLLAAALRVAKFIAISTTNWVTLFWAA
jgi:hypothetical protein